MVFDIFQHCCYHNNYYTLHFKNPQLPSWQLFFLVAQRHYSAGLLLRPVINIPRGNHFQRNRPLYHRRHKTGISSHILSDSRENWRDIWPQSDTNLLYMHILNSCNHVYFYLSFSFYGCPKISPIIFFISNLFCQPPAQWSLVDKPKYLQQISNEAPPSCRRNNPHRLFIFFHKILPPAKNFRFYYLRPALLFRLNFLRHAGNYFFISNFSFSNVLYL